MATLVGVQALQAYDADVAQEAGWSAPAIADNRWAIMMTVLPATNRPTASWISASFLGVDERGRLIEHHDRGIGEDRPCQSDPLPLPSRQVRTAFTHHGVVAIGTLFDETVRLGFPGGFDQLIVGRVPERATSDAAVVLPSPDGPTSAVSVPGSARVETWSSTGRPTRPSFGGTRYADT